MEQETPEDKLLNQILNEIDKHEQKKKQFVEAMKGFFEDCDNVDQEDQQ
ncbi:hypothetical protein [Flavobacterium daemonense]|nr:hypothetical protein [Flavobacterium daemonense]KAF2337209.1 hypothetical protein FND99_02005 [Flavobacterium daemonense]